MVKQQVDFDVTAYAGTLGGQAVQINLNLPSSDQRDWRPQWTTLAAISLLAAAIFAPALISLAKDFSATYQPHQIGLIVLVLILCACAIWQQTTLRDLRAQVAAHEKEAQELRRLALFDPLTGLFNRRMVQQRLAQEIARSERSRYPLIVLCLDINNLKQINDRLGHLAGDEVLKAAAHRIQRAIRFSDAPVRMGGDEFMIILPECNSEQVEIVLGRLAPLHVEYQDEKIPISFSAGWTICRTGETADEVIDRADQALYAQKRLSKKRVVLL